jgi:hypothetical protein
MQEWKKQMSGPRELLISVAIVFLALITSNCGSTSAVVGTGQSPSLVINEANVQFGNVPLSTNASQTLTFTNPASSATSVTVNNLTISGAGFSLVQPPSVPMTIAAGQSASITVQALPTTAGAASATITISSNANPSTATVALSMTGIAGPAQTISGTLSPAVQNAGATVTVTGTAGTVDTVTADSNGKYTLFIFANGTFTITPTISGLFFSPPSQTVTVNTSGSPQTFDFTASSNAPAPSIQSLSPASVLAGSSAQVLTVNGSNFVTGATVTYNGSARGATLVNSGQMAIQLTTADLSVAGSFPVVVTNPAPGGGASNTVSLAVNNPVPAISSLSPASALVGGSAQTLTINGSGFIAGSRVTYNGVAHVATFLGNTQLTIQLGTADLATAGSFAVIVTNPTPGGGVSNSASFAIGNPVPAITSLSPSSLAVGSTAQSLIINGSGLISASTVTYNGVLHPATLVSASQLTIQLSTSDLAAAGSFAVVVSNAAPNGGTSNSVNFSVSTNPIPMIASTSPASFIVGSAAQTLTIKGSNFVSAATATFNGIAHTVSFSTANQITMQLSASDLATAGSFAVVVTNPAPGGGNSNSVNVAVNNAAPSITSLSPSSVVAGSAPQTLTINGSNFAAGSAVNYNGVTHPATLVSATQLTIQLSASDVAAAGNFAVTVTNPAPGGGSSNAVNFQVANPSPILGSLSPASLAVGSSAQPLTINGSNFVSGSVVTYNGTAHAASFVSANQLTIQLTTADLATAGSNPVAVTNPAPGGGASLSISFVVVGLNVSPANLSFGSVDDGTTNPAQNGTLTATGGTVTINAPTVSGAGITLVPSGFSFPVTLNAGQSVQYSVSFSPAAGSPGVVNGSAQFTSNVNAVTETISGTGARNVLVTWAASPTAGVTYNVYRCTGSCGTPLSGFTQIKNGIGVLSYTDDDPALISSTTYSYVITAVLSGAESTPSNVTSATVP